MFGLVSFAARKGISDAATAAAPPANKKARAHRTGVRGETFAYWYLRRHGYIFVARNYKVPGMKGEIDLIGYDGRFWPSLKSKRARAMTNPPVCPKTQSTGPSAT
jgi:Uncharacterised protein family UPF0102